MPGQALFVLLIQMLIYAWNEFGEGGIVAPTRGQQEMKLDAIREVFGAQ